jgi:hypothetical protein
MLRVKFLSFQIEWLVFFSRVEHGFLNVRLNQAEEPKELISAFTVAFP